MTDFQDTKPNTVENQVGYPLDYVSQEVLKQFIKPAFPINSIYISVDSTNPALTLGYGIWEAFATGRTIVGFDSGQTEFDTIEETGGAKTHTLTLAEIPAHTHTGGVTTGPNNWGSGGGTDTGITGSAGGGGAHNNLQPYIVVYMWKRTA